MQSGGGLWAAHQVRKDDVCGHPGGRGAGHSYLSGHRGCGRDPGSGPVAAHRAVVRSGCDQTLVGRGRDQAWALPVTEGGMAVRARGGRGAARSPDKFGLWDVPTMKNGLSRKSIMPGFDRGHAPLRTPPGLRISSMGRVLQSPRVATAHPVAKRGATPRLAMNRVHLSVTSVRGAVARASGSPLLRFRMNRSLPGCRGTRKQETPGLCPCPREP